MNVDFDLVTADELGELLRLRPETVKHMARIGKIPSIQISPKVIRFSKNAVRVALECMEQSKPATPEDKGVSHGQK